MRLLPRRTGQDPDKPQVPLRLRRRGMSPAAAGLIVVVLVVLATYAAFTKRNPLHHGFQLKGVFTSAVNVAKNTPVRIAGVNVGTVEGIGHYNGSSVAVVTMSLDNGALPIHSDATLKIRPRIFLEGNFFVDMTPGSPSAPILKSGATLPITQTADPVQLDQVLSALNSDTRTDLQALLDAYGTALTHVPTPAQDVTQDPIVRGKTAAQALNDASLRAPRSLRNSTIVNQALAGEEPHDVSLLVASLGRVSGALGQSETDLQGLISNFDVTLGAFATQSAALNAAVGLLPGALTTTDRAFAALNASFPVTRAFALDLIPAVKQTPATTAAALPWIAQLEALMSPAELGNLSEQLVALAPEVGALTPAQTTFASQQLYPVSRCFSQVLIPAGNVKLQDAGGSTGAPNYQELWYALVGLNSAGSNFDGNGSFLRGLSGGGGNYFKSGPIRVFGESAPSGGATNFADVRTVFPPLGTSPAAPVSATEPPLKPNVLCGTQSLPNFNGPAAHGPPDGPGR